MEKIGKYRIHEMAGKLPMMSDDQFAELKKSIKLNGQLEPIVILSEKEQIVIDGRNRLKAIIEINSNTAVNKLKPSFITLNDAIEQGEQGMKNRPYLEDEDTIINALEHGDTEETIKHFVILKNVIRRHLSDFEKYLTLSSVTEVNTHGGSRHTESQELKNNSCKSLSEVAGELGWSKAKLKQAIYIDKNGDEETKDKALSGEYSIGKAYEIAKGKSEPEDFDIDKELEKIAIKLKKSVENKFGLLHWEQLLIIINNL